MALLTIFLIVIHYVGGAAAFLLPIVTPTPSGSFHRVADAEACWTATATYSGGGGTSTSDFIEKKLPSGWLCVALEAKNAQVGIRLSWLALCGGASSSVGYWRTHLFCSVSVYNFSVEVSGQFR